MEIYSNPAPQEWPKILARPTENSGQVKKTVEQIIKEVQLRGDDALLDFTAKFDGVRLADLQVAEIEITLAESALESSLVKAIKLAYKNIKTFHQSQKELPNVIETMPGIFCWRKSVGIEKVGLYIPGGTAPLFSTVLMLGIPAKLAGCKEIILCSPPDRNGNIHPAILYAAKLAGITQIYKVGGAQAIAAMAYGTETVPSVYKIFGPGNSYVTAAKQLVSLSKVAIDMPAGPSELMVFADETAKPAFIAADLLSQAEHGVDSQVILVTTEDKMAQAIKEAVEQQLDLLPRKNIAKESIQNSSIIVTDAENVLPLINQYAPEHLLITTDDPEEIAFNVINAGSIFLGHYTPESLGDYASGTNHTLPTNGYAKSYSGVSLDSFVRKITFQKANPDGLKSIGPAVMEMAKAEELEGHSKAVELRLNALKNQEI